MRETIREYPTKKEGEGGENIEEEKRQDRSPTL